jgi:tetratricopeptide (TPR) repeat protein
MRFYHRRPEMKQATLDRCFTEARNGYVDLALLRLGDLLQDFDQDPQVIYEKGLITWEFLGQGGEAGDLFRQAYAADPCHAYAAQNASYLAKHDGDFRVWVEIALKISARHDPWVSQVPRILAELDHGASYQELLIEEADYYYKAKKFGKSAAAGELAFLADFLPPDLEVNVRLGRANSLRALDREAHYAREGRFEAFPPEERLALQEAIRELERAQTADPYMPEIRNLQAAWFILLGRHEEAVSSADEAIRLRPHLYAGPLINKAHALLNLSRAGEANQVAQEALKQAQASGVPGDLKQARFYLQKTQNPTDHHPWEYEEHLRQWRNRTSRAAAEAVSHMNLSLSRYGTEVLSRFRSLSSLNQGAIFLMAELLSQVDSDILSEVFINFPKPEEEVRQAMVGAALSLLGQASGVLPRDAARFLVGVLLEDPLLPAARTAYRHWILTPVASGPPSWSRLPELMERALARIQPDLPGLIARQEPIVEDEREQAWKALLKDFQEIPALPEQLEIKDRQAYLLSRQMSRLEHCLGRLGQSLEEASKDGMEVGVHKRAQALFQNLAGTPGDGAREVYQQLPFDLAAVEDFLATWKPGDAPGVFKILQATEKIREELRKLQKLVDDTPPEVFEEIVRGLPMPRPVVRPFPKRNFPENLIPGDFTSPRTSSDPVQTESAGRGTGTTQMNHRALALGWWACLITLALSLGARSLNLFTLSWLLTLPLALGLSLLVGVSLAHLLSRRT